MPTERDFLVALGEAPDDDVNRLVFADWLEDHADPRSAIASNIDGFHCAMRAWMEAPASYDRQTAYFLHLHTTHPELKLPTPPSLETILRLFSPAQWEAIEHLQEPTLILVPPLDFAAFEALFNAHLNTSKEYSTHVADLYRTHQHPPPQQWQAFFIEGAQNMPAPAESVLDQTLAERLREEEEECPNETQGMDRNLYACLMLDALHRGQPMDTDTWTLLNADALYQKGNQSRVPLAAFHPGYRQVLFCWVNAVVRYRNARVRRAVGGDVA